VTESEQSAFLWSAFEMLRDDFPYVAGAAAYELRDSQTDEDGRCWQCEFGVLEQDLSRAKPGYWGFFAGVRSTAPRPAARAKLQRVIGERRSP
jgi:hypothetical protein